MNELIAGMHPSAVGILMKEMVERAMSRIQKELQEHEVADKENKYKKEDLVTSADYGAQREIVKIIEECFPMAGIVAEENGLRKDPRGEQKYWFTIDPLDGTKAFVREQSDGIGCMVSLFDGKEVIAACVGDVMTGEKYYFKPGSENTNRLHKQRHRYLKYQEKSKRRLLLRDHPGMYSLKIQLMSNPGSGVFDSIDVSNGSIGVNMAKLWKNEVQAVALRPVTAMPWDWLPVIGISKRLGYKFFELTDKNKFVEVEEKRMLSLEPVEYLEMLVVHESDVGILK